MTDVPRTGAVGKRFSFEQRKEDWLKRVFSNPDYTQSAKCAAVCLSWHANRETWEAWPGYGRISKLAGMSHRSAIRGVDELEAGGDIKVKRRRSGKKNDTNLYCLVLDPRVFEAKGVVPDLHQGSANLTLGGSANLSPKPLKEEPPNITRREEKICGRVRKANGESWHSLAQPIFTDTGKSDVSRPVSATHFTYQEALARGSGPPISRFDRR